MFAESASDTLSDSSLVSLSAGVTGREVLLDEPGLVKIDLFAAGGCKVDVDWRFIALFSLPICSFLGDANHFPRASEGGLAIFQ